MNCPNCDFLTKPGQKFCPSCGAILPNSGIQAIATTVPDLHLITDGQSEPLSELDGEPVAAPPREPHHITPELPASTDPQRLTPDVTPDTHPTPYDSPRGIESVVVERRGQGPVLVVAGAALLLLALVTLVVLAWTGVGRGAAGVSATATPIVIDPVAVLDRARAAVSNVQSVKYRAEAGFFGIDTAGAGITSTRPLTISLEGQMGFPDRFTMQSNVQQLGEYIVIADRTWSRRNDGDPWSEQESDSLSLGLINPITLFDYLQHYQTGTPVQIGSETNGGITVHRIRFQVDTDRMIPTVIDPSLSAILATSRVDVDAWIDDKGYLLESMVLSVESENGTGVLLRTYFSDYNGPIEIAPPGT